jgi:hypothetical protein
MKDKKTFQESVDDLRKAWDNLILTIATEFGITKLLYKIEEVLQKIFK